MSVDDPMAKRLKLEEGVRDVKQEDGLFESVPDSTGSWGEVSYISTLSSLAELQK